MPIEADRVETITFDSFTTLVDVRGSTRTALEEHLGQVKADRRESIARLWRFRAVDYRMVSTYVGVYETYERTSREALEYALDVHDVELPDEELDELASIFYELDVFDDIYDGLETLHDAGYELAILSNGTPELLETIVDRANVREFVNERISADEIRTYKPHPKIYEHAAERVGVPIDRIAHVATPWYDIYGAIHAGMQGVWVNRRGAPWDRFDGEPDDRVASFNDLPALFDA